MAETTGISWADMTWNPWIGCRKVSPGCKHCYAERHVSRFGDFSKRVVTSESYWNQPIRWNRSTGKALSNWKESSGRPKPSRPRVFCASLADVFEDFDGAMVDNKGRVLNKKYEVSDSAEMHNDELLTMDDVRARLFKLIDDTPHLDWLLLTKRPENIERMWPWCGNIGSPSMGFGWSRPNVWLGTSVENQEQADKRIPELLKCNDMVSVLWLSCEPLLGPIKLSPAWNHGNFDPDFDVDINWVVVGGESGPKARPMNPEWVRSIRDQCSAAGVPLHFKQWGEWGLAGTRGEFCFNPGASVHDLVTMDRVGVKQAGRMLDGVLHNEFPKV